MTLLTPTDNMTTTPQPLTFCLPPGVCQLDASSVPSVQSHHHSASSSYAVLSFTLTQQLQSPHAAAKHGRSVHSQQHAATDLGNVGLSWWGAGRVDELHAGDALQYTVVIPVERFLHYLLDTPQHQLQLVVRTTHNNSTIAEGSIDLSELIHHLGRSSIIPHYTATQAYALTHTRNRATHGNVTIRTELHVYSPASATPSRSTSQASAASVRGLAERATRLKQQLQHARQLEIQQQQHTQIHKPVIRSNSKPPVLYPASSPVDHHKTIHHVDDSKQHLSPMHQPIRMRADSANSFKQRQRSPLKPIIMDQTSPSVPPASTLDTLAVVCIRLRSVVYHSDCTARQLVIKLFATELLTYQLPTPTGDTTSQPSHECQHVYRVSNHRLLQQLASCTAVAQLRDAGSTSPLAQAEPINLQPLGQLLQQQSQTPLKATDAKKSTIAELQQRCTVPTDVTVELNDPTGMHIATCIVSLSIGSEAEVEQLDDMERAARTLQKHARSKSISHQAERKSSVEPAVKTAAATAQTPVKKPKSSKAQHKSPASSPIPATIKSPKSRSVQPIKPIAVDLMQPAAAPTDTQSQQTLQRSQQHSYIAPTQRQSTASLHSTQPARTPPTDDEPLPDFRQLSPDLLKGKKKQPLHDDLSDGSHSHRPSTAKSVVSRPRTSTSVPPRGATLSFGHVRRVSIIPRSQTASRLLSYVANDNNRPPTAAAITTDTVNSHHHSNPAEAASLPQRHFTAAHPDETDLTIASQYDEGLLCR